MIDQRPCAVFVLTHPWMQRMIRAAAPAEFEVRFLDAEDSRQVQQLLPMADFLVTVALPPWWVSYLSRCRLVQLQGVGSDAIDRKGLADAHIPLAITPEGTVIGVAEHTIMLILALCRQLIPVQESMRRGDYDNVTWRANSYFLHGKLLGIIGFGRIGQQVARLARAFGTHIIYHDIVRRSDQTESELAAAYHPFEYVVAQSDIVSVHTALTPQTERLFDAAAFARMKQGALFINTSRGGSYDMNALYDSLVSGHLRGAGLDVFNPEPPPLTHPILSLPNVVCTPHIAAGTVDAHRLKAQAQFENFQRILAGQQALNIVPPLEGVTR